MPIRPLRPDESHLAEMLPEGEDLGPAMRECSKRQRVFVVLLLDQGSKQDRTRAAEMAGYQGSTRNSLKVTAHWLAHNPKVQAAVLEEARKRMTLGTGAAAALLLETIADEKAHRKDRLRAAADLLDRSGIPAMSEHKVSVERTLSRDEKLLRVVELSRLLGRNPSEFLGSLVELLPDDLKTLERAEVDVTPEGGHHGDQDDYANRR